MFERFTERARQVLVLAEEDAKALKHNYIGTEHILLGLVREKEGLAARVLADLEITEDRIRAQIVRIIGAGEEETSGQVPYTPRAKKVLEVALREALSLGHNYIGTEHILLGLIRQNEGIGARILLDYHIDPDDVRDRVMRPLGTPRAAADELAQVQRLKEEAIEAGRFEAAAALRDKERKLIGQAPWRRPCPTCLAIGINPVISTEVCPKCNGERTVCAVHSVA